MNQERIKMLEEIRNILEKKEGIDNSSERSELYNELREINNNIYSYPEDERAVYEERRNIIKTRIAKIEDKNKLQKKALETKIKNLRYPIENELKKIDERINDKDNGLKKYQQNLEISIYKEETKLEAEIANDSQLKDTEKMIQISKNIHLLHDTREKLNEELRKLFNQRRKLQADLVNLSYDKITAFYEEIESIKQEETKLDDKTKDNATTESKDVSEIKKVATGKASRKTSNTTDDKTKDNKTTESEDVSGTKEVATGEKQGKKLNTTYDDLLRFFGETDDKTKDNATTESKDVSEIKKVATGEEQGKKPNTAYDDTFRFFGETDDKTKDNKTTESKDASEAKKVVKNEQKKPEIEEKLMKMSEEERIEEEKYQQLIKLEKKHWWQKIGDKIKDKFSKRSKKNPDQQEKTEKISNSASEETGNSRLENQWYKDNRVEGARVQTETEQSETVVKKERPTVDEPEQG